MKTSYFLSCWGNRMQLGEAVEVAADWGYDGVEGPPPEDDDLRRRVADDLATSGLPFIGEIVTGGNYVPKPGMTVGEHLEDFERLLTGRFDGFTPKFINVLGGSDRWTVEESVSFFAGAINLADRQGHSLVFETHRGRSMFNPWVTGEILDALPEMRLNCDFSHWVVVAERLVMDEEPEILERCAKACRHMHARVGYDQGPQVPDPSLSWHAADLDAHLRWWNALREQRRGEGAGEFTVTPEFGPDGYLQVNPVDGKPVADLHEVNRWMVEHLKSVEGFG